MSRYCALACALGLALLTASLAQAQTTTAKPGVAPKPAMIRAEPTADAAALFAAWDSNDDGALSPVEFSNGWQNLRRISAQRRLAQRFNALDRNDNNAIDADEYRNMALLKRAGKSAPPLSKFDANRNGRLELGEYLGLFDHLSDQRRYIAPAAGRGARK